MTETGRIGLRLSYDKVRKCLFKYKVIIIIPKYIVWLTGDAITNPTIKTKLVHLWAEVDRYYVGNYIQKATIDITSLISLFCQKKVRQISNAGKHDGRLLIWLVIEYLNN